MDKFNFEPRSVYKFESNPEKPMDLETGTGTDFLGLDVHFFNLGRHVLDKVVICIGYVPLYFQILNGRY